MIISDILSYPFLLRALIVGFLVSVSSSLLGVSLVLRRFSMIGDGLSHVGFGALGVAAVLYLSPMAVTLPVVIIAAFLLLRLSGRNSGDRAIALISSSALAVGVIAVSAGGVNTDLNAFLFGSILSIARSDAMIAAVAAVMTFFVYIVFYHQIYASTFDPSFAEATGIKCSRYTSILASHNRCRYAHARFSADLFPYNIPSNHRHACIQVISDGVCTGCSGISDSLHNRLPCIICLLASSWRIGSRSAYGHLCCCIYHQQSSQVPQDFRFGLIWLLIANFLEIRYLFYATCYAEVSLSNTQGFLLIKQMKRLNIQKRMQLE